MHRDMHAAVTGPGHPDAVREVVLKDPDLERTLDRVARVAAACARAPTALVCIMDAEDPDATHCFGLVGTLGNGAGSLLPRAFLQHVASRRDPLMVPDARRDPSMAALEDLGLVSYVSIPLMLPEDARVLGTLCVADARARQWGEEEIGALMQLSVMLVTEIRLRVELAATGRSGAVPEAQLRTLLEHSSEIVALFERDGRLRYVSPSVEVVLGYRPEELHGSTALELVHPGDRIAISGAFQRMMERPEEIVTLEFRHRHRAGGWRVLDAAARNLVQDGGIRGVVMNARDVTSRKETEARATLQMEKLAALRAIDVAIAGSTDLRIALGVLLDQARGLLHVDAAAVLLVEPHAQVLKYAEGRGFRAGRIQETRTRLGEGPAGRAALERRTVYVPEIRVPGTFPRAALVEDEGFVSYVAVPLVAKGEAQGVLELFHRTPLEPDPDWFDFLESLAGQAAIAVDNARLFERLQRSRAELAVAYDATLEGWARALELRCRETEGHTRRVSDLAVRLARQLGLEEADLLHVRRGALLHDVGKLAIPDAILLKPGPLTDEEWTIMRLHPVYAHEWLSTVRVLRPALEIPYAHRERWDGSGYPRGLAGEEIPLPARIFAVVDAWDALSSDRPYRKAWAPHRIRDHLSEQAGRHFDPEVARTFLQLPDL